MLLLHNNSMAMLRIGRREFLAASAGSLLDLKGASAPEKPRIGLVQSTHRRLVRPASPEDPLDYERVRDMVWKAIEYGRPRAGSLEAKIRAGSWVVVKPNLVFLRSQPPYCTGDITDMRVIRAVLEYLARRSSARRITIAEGGSYRGLRDPATNDVVRQEGVRVDGATFDWGGDEFPGAGGTFQSLLQDLGRSFPGKTFDYIDLSYDAVRDASGALKRIEVPRTAKGVGAFGNRPDYFITNTIRNCDFLISVPVMKVHQGCGITACFKNYVGTAPREAYQSVEYFANGVLHDEQTIEDRFDGMIVDLAAFHPPDYCVIDGIRGLQYAVHNAHRPDQAIRNNLVMAAEDPVAADALAARLMGFNPWDIDYLHMAALRGLGTLDLGAVEVVGDDVVRLERRWGKPRAWHGRCNREWLVSSDPDTPTASWSRYTGPTDTLQLAKALPGAAEGVACAAAFRVRAEGHRKAFLWMGVRGKVTVLLNGEQVAEEESRTRYRVGQFQKPLELRPGENLLVFRASSPAVRLSAQLVGPRNDGDTLDGIRPL
jgi:uncharacterized protein (DUF362 family)